ncbi:fused response regulator/phosphatase [bacterium]|nr:fused response regulator/phosphatase [bacterium]
MSPRARLLIVDDAPSDIRILLENLKDLYQVQVATSGAKALQLARQSPPDLILLDVLMPEMDGYQVLACLQKMPECASVPVIFLTSLQQPMDEEKALELGAVDYITKPYHPPLVKARIRNHLELKRHRDQLEQMVEIRSQELMDSRLARQKLENDLKLANQLQLSMLPPARGLAQGKPGYQVAALLRPARAIGGDLYDYIPLGTDRLLFAVGDVSDKGVTAALFMVRVVTLLHWLAPSLTDPAQLLHDLNQALCRDNGSCMFVTLGCGLLDLKRQQLLYASGGHEPPWLLSPGHPARLLELSGGPALGLFESAHYPLHTLSLPPGHSFLLTSDGVTDASNAQDQAFGVERLQSLLNGLAEVSPAAVIADCRQAIEKFTSGSEPFDDQTILVIQPAPD